MLENNRYDIKILPVYADNQRKKYQNIEYTSPANYNYVSRYSTTDRIFDKNNIAYHETYNMKEIPETDSDRYFKVDNTTVNRLDIIAYKCYGFTIYWWIIAIANNIMNSINVELDTVLRIPPLSSLYIDGSVLSNE